MAHTSTVKILNELKADGLIEGWSRSRDYDETRDITETRFGVRSTQVRVEHEIYGRKAVMYFSCKDDATAELVRVAVNRAGGATDSAWMGRDRFDCFSARVAYFRGPRWWE